MPNLSIVRANTVYHRLSKHLAEGRTYLWKEKQVLVKLLGLRKFQIWTYFLNASADHWKHCGGPHLACGPLFAHPCPK